MVAFDILHPFLISTRLTEVKDNVPRLVHLSITVNYDDANLISRGEIPCTLMTYAQTLETINYLLLGVINSFNYKILEYVII